MTYFLAMIAIMLTAVTIGTIDKKEKGLSGLSRGLLRVLAMAAMCLSFFVAFDMVDFKSPYYGYVKDQHKLTTAIVFGLGAITLSIISTFGKHK